MDSFQPTEYYISGDSHVVILVRFGNGMNAVIEYSERHNVAAIQAMHDRVIANYYELVELEPWFWQKCISCIREG